jgi:hypothetical protein
MTKAELIELTLQKVQGGIVNVATLLIHFVMCM